MLHRLLAAAPARETLAVLALVTVLSVAESRSDEPARAAKPGADAMQGEAAGQVRDDNALKMKLVWCPPGAFEMGDFDDDDVLMDKEGNPKPDVTLPARAFLSRGYWLGRCEVTQGEWEQVMGSTPWKRKDRAKEGSDFPATYVSYEDALGFCRLLTDLERRRGRLVAGWEYTLPSEAEWERACRAKSTTRYSFGSDETKLAEYAWTAENSTFAGEPWPHRTAQKKANPWGLCDMHGNVWELCRDACLGVLPGGRDPCPPGVAGSRRTIRGGCYHDFAPRCRSAMRGNATPDHRGPSIGFRVALIATPTAK